MAIRFSLQAMISVYSMRLGGRFLNTLRRKTWVKHFFVLGIEIHIDRSHELLGLSQKTDVNYVLKRFIMDNCSPYDDPIVNGHRFFKPVFIG